MSGGSTGPTTHVHVLGLSRLSCVSVEISPSTTVFRFPVVGTEASTEVGEKSSSPSHRDPGTGQDWTRPGPRRHNDGGSGDRPEDQDDDEPEREQRLSADSAQEVVKTLNEGYTLKVNQSITEFRRPQSKTTNVDSWTDYLYCLCQSPGLEE